MFISSVKRSTTDFSSPPSSVKEEGKSRRLFEKEGRVATALDSGLRRRLLLIKGDSRVRYSRELMEAETVIEFASEAAKEAAGLLVDIEETATAYFSDGLTDEEKAELSERFSYYKEELQRVVDTSTFEDVPVLQDSSSSPLISILVGPKEYETRFTVSFDSAVEVDPSLVSLSGSETDVLSGIEAEVTKNEQFQAQVRGYRQGLNAQKQMVENSPYLFDGSGSLSPDEVREMMNGALDWIQRKGGDKSGGIFPPVDRVLSLMKSEGEKEDGQEK